MYVRPIRDGAWAGPAIALTSDHTYRSDRLNESAWSALYAEGPYSDLLDVSMPQAGTNAIRVYVGDQKIRSAESAQYFIRWVDQLKAMAEKWPSWRSQKERQHVFSQFEEARRVYQRLAIERQ